MPGKELKVPIYPCLAHGNYELLIAQMPTNSRLFIVYEPGTKGDLGLFLSELAQTRYSLGGGGI